MADIRAELMYLVLPVNHTKPTVTTMPSVPQRTLLRGTLSKTTTFGRATDAYSAKQQNQPIEFSLTTFSDSYLEAK